MEAVNISRLHLTDIAIRYKQVWCAIGHVYFQADRL